MKKLSLHNQQGFSLVEAMIAMVILSIGLLAVGLMQIGAMKANTNANSRSDGVVIAQSIMDTLRTLPMDNALLSDALPGEDLDSGEATAGPNFTPNNADHSGDELYANDTITGASGQNYTIFWNVADNAATDTKTVRLFVYWIDQKFGVNRVVITSTLGGLYL